MCPDRGSLSHGSLNQQESFAADTQRPSIDGGESALQDDDEQQQHNFADVLAERADDDTNFTIRGVVVGSIIGIVICFSNTYFGLQTGWVSGMVMPASASLIGFGFFKSIARFTSRRFTPVENVLVQTVAGAVGTMPLGVGCVGVLPALKYLLKPSENGPIDLSLGKLIIWSLGICFFGVFVAVPLRKEMIIREKLRFPSGTATALMIGVLHGDKQPIKQSSRDGARNGDIASYSPRNMDQELFAPGDSNLAHNPEADWKKKIKLLAYAFGVSAIYTLVSYFLPQLRSVPIFGTALAANWAWSFNPSTAYVAQGIIMGPATTLHMLVGAILGWAFLSPMAKNNGWAPGPVEDWETGSKGWIIWVSLAIMLADSLVNLGWLALRPLIRYGPGWMANVRELLHRQDLQAITSSPGAVYTRLRDSATASGIEESEQQYIRHRAESKSRANRDDISEPDAPPEHLVSNRIVGLGFVLSVIFCIVGVHIAFYEVMPFWATILAILFSLVLSLMGVRALGETDLNPVSGISKLTQLVFAVLTPNSPNAIAINMVAGAISESAALQAGDLMQDLKAGHLVGASPAAQFWGQIIGSAVGAIAASLVYKLYTSVYEIPSKLFAAPSAYVWYLTARLVTGKGLPEGAWQWSLGGGLLWAGLTMLRIYGRDTRWVSFVPGGIAVATAMYNVPSFTLARTIGGLIAAYWVRFKKRDEETVIVLASGFILGEGVVSIVNLVLASLNVPHF